MNKVIELAREVWGFENWTHVQLERIERFYQLARADLEAENTELRTALDRAAKSLESRCAFGEADVARAALGEKDAEV